MTHNWKERFEEGYPTSTKFDVYDDVNDGKFKLCYDQAYPENVYELDSEKVKSFIATLLEEKEKEVRSEILGNMKLKHWWWYIFPPKRMLIDDMKLRISETNPINDRITKKLAEDFLKKYYK